MRTLAQAVANAACGALGSDQIEARQPFKLERDFMGFAGHFPDNPLLPAFVQIFMGRWVLEQWLEKPLSLVEVNRAKFMQPIGPGTLLVRCKRIKAGYLVQIDAAEGLSSQFVLGIGAQTGGVA